MTTTTTRQTESHPTTTAHALVAYRAAYAAVSDSRDHTATGRARANAKWRTAWNAAARVIDDMNLADDAQSALIREVMATLDAVAYPGANARRFRGRSMAKTLHRTIGGLETVQRERIAGARTDGGAAAADRDDDADADTETADEPTGADADDTVDVATDDTETNPAPDADVTDDETDAVAPPINGGTPEQVYPQYDLQMVPVELDGMDTGQRFVLRDGNFIAAVTDSYQLLPNERVLTVGDYVASDIGASPFSPNAGKWSQHLSSSHALTDPERRRVRAFYEVGDGMTVSHPHRDDERVEFGYVVSNSIDTSEGFRVGLYAYWPADDILVWLNASALKPNWRGYEMTTDYHMHRSGLDVDSDALKARIKSALELTDVLKLAFSAWPHEPVTPSMVKQLLARFADKDVPDWVTAAGEALEKAIANDSLSDDVTENDVIDYAIPDEATVWSLYTSIVANVWNDPHAGDLTKGRKMTRLHNVFEPLAVGQAAKAAQSAPVYTPGDEADADADDNGDGSDE